MIKSLILRFYDYVRSMYVNMKILPFSQAVHMPIFLKHNIRVENIHRGCIRFECDVVPKTLVLGGPGASFVHEEYGVLHIEDDAKLVVRGKTILAGGAKIWIGGKGILSLGKHVYFNQNVSLQCVCRVDIGDSVLGGWNVSIRDTDGHKVTNMIDGTSKPVSMPVVLHDKVWIGADAVILKGTEVSEGSIIACNSVVCGIVASERHVLLAGIPARLKKHNVLWEE